MGRHLTTQPVVGAALAALTTVIAFVRRTVREYVAEHVRQTLAALGLTLGLTRGVVVRLGLVGHRGTWVNARSCSQDASRRRRLGVQPVEAVK